MNSKSLCLSLFSVLQQYLLSLCGWFTLNKHIFRVFQIILKFLIEKCHLCGMRYFFSMKHISTLFRAIFTFHERRIRVETWYTVDLSHGKSIFMWFFVILDRFDGIGWAFDWNQSSDENISIQSIEFNLNKLNFRRRKKS